MTSTREQLEADLREAEKELQELNEQLDDKPGFGLGAGSSGAYSWEMALARKERVMARIEALQEALTRLAEGGYGRCEGCGDQIDPERLEILPATALCVDCAREASAMPGSAARVAGQAVVPRR
jgi:RNA polymerase-binding transcription factor DksA